MRSGATNSTSDGAVTIANADFSRSINGTSRTELRLAIGGKFAVKKDGTLYASGGHFNGTISGGSITIGSKFSVDSNGNLKATDADLTSVSATGGTFKNITVSGTSKINSATLNTCSIGSYLSVESTHYTGQSREIVAVESVGIKTA